jgi:hypothetical protein
VVKGFEDLEAAKLLIRLLATKASSSSSFLKKLDTSDTPFSSFSNLGTKFGRILTGEFIIKGVISPF